MRRGTNMRPTLSQQHSSAPKSMLSKLTADSSSVFKDPSRVDAWGDIGKKSLLPIHPDSRFRMVWDLIIFGFIIYTTCATPIRIAFTDVSNTENVLWLWLDFGVDCVFLVDIVLNFNTGFVSSEIADYVILDPVAIRHRYLRSWFMIDLMACLPIDFVVYYASESLQGGGTSGEILNFLLVLRLIKLIKLLRLFKLKNMIEDWEEKFFSLTFNPGVRRLLSIMFWVLILSHMNACCWYYIAAVLDDGSDDNWVNHFARDLKDQHDVGSLYLMSFYWSVVTLTSVGYGDIRPVNNSERFYCILASFVGASVFGYIIGHMSSIVANLNQANTVFQSRMDAINSYLRYRRVPVELQFKIRRYFKYYIERKTVFDEKQILDDLSHQLRVDLSTFLIQDIFQQMELFHGISDPVFLSKIVTLLKPLSAAPGDVIIQEGQIGMEMYLLVRGAVEVLSGDGRLVYAVLGPGTHFGEIGTMDAKPERRTASVRAIEHCELFSLAKEDLFTVSRDFPEIERTLHKLAQERVIISKNLRTQIKVQRLAAGKAVDVRHAKLGDEGTGSQLKSGNSRTSSDFLIPSLWNGLSNMSSKLKPSDKSTKIHPGAQAARKSVHEADDNNTRRASRRSRNRSLVMCDVDNDVRAQATLLSINSDLVDKSNIRCNSIKPPESPPGAATSNEGDQTQSDASSDCSGEDVTADDFEFGTEVSLPGSVLNFSGLTGETDKDSRTDSQVLGNNTVKPKERFKRSSTVSSHFEEIEMKIKQRQFVGQLQSAVPRFGRVGTIQELLGEEVESVDGSRMSCFAVTTNNEVAQRIKSMQAMMEQLHNAVTSQASQIDTLTCIIKKQQQQCSSPTTTKPVSND